MEISEHDLGRLVAEADDRHRASLPELEAALAAVHLEGSPGPRLSRRQLLGRAAAGGAAVAVGSVLVPVAGLLEPAAAADATPTDATLVAFAESVELAFVTAYNEAAGLAQLTSGALKSAFTTFAGHHQQHAAAFGALATRLSAKTSHTANAKMLDVARGQFDAARTQADVLKVGYLLETSAAATYLVALGTLKVAEAQKLSASVLPVESEHAVVFGSAQGLAIADLVPTFVTIDRAIDPTKYPAA